MRTHIIIDEPATSKAYETFVHDIVDSLFGVMEIKILQMSSQKH
jgi:hypothetical protein